MGIPSSERMSPPPAKEKLTPPNLYEKNTQEVKNKLRQFGFGPTVEFLTPEGIDRPAYLSFARQRLLGQEYRDGVKGKELPQKIGEVEIPENVRQHGQDIFALLFSYNVGYGHLRPALAMQNLIELMGGEAKSMFLGGAEDVIPPTSKTDFGGYKDLNRLLREISWYYRITNLKTAYRQGMMHEIPNLTDPDPEYSKLARRFLFIASDWKKWLKESPEEAIAEVMTFNRERNWFTRGLSKVLLLAVTRRSLRNLIRGEFKEHPDAEKLLISTHPIVSEAFGTIPPLSKTRIDYIDANFQPDIGMFYDSYTKSPRTYTERPETVEKWGIKHHDKPTQHSTVMNGYVTPISVFDRTAITEQRKQALENGQPLTVIATASGNAPAQLGAFKEFVLGNLDNFKDNSLRIVIECGAEEGGGLAVYNELKQIVDEQHLAENIVLHASQTPEASLQFFEALSWTPQPIALQVKASEMTRIAQALNIPLISTGALGDHELWNVGTTILENPTSVIFPEKVSKTMESDVVRVFSKDILVKKHPERNYVESLLANITQQTAHNTEQLLTLVKQYITSEEQSHSDAGAMLHLLSDMLERKQQQVANKTKSQIESTQNIQ